MFFDTLRKFIRDDKGNVAIMTAFASAGLLAAVGAGVDLSRAYSARQKLVHTANLGCQYAMRSNVVSLRNGTTSNNPYVVAVNKYITDSLASQKLSWAQKNATPFLYTAPSSAKISLAADVPAAFSAFLGIATMPVGAAVDCNPVATTPPQPFVPFTEGFEVIDCVGVCFEWFWGTTTGVPPTQPVSSITQKPNYTGATGTKWFALGYCLEVDAKGVIVDRVVEGVNHAELDCDNGAGGTGNSSISTKGYFPAGKYELRYAYRARVPYPDYGDGYICGTTDADVSWATNRNPTWKPFSDRVYQALQTNRINVYFDKNPTNQNPPPGEPPPNTPPTHQAMTIDGVAGHTLAGKKMIDVCVIASDWLTRSVKITVEESGDYWLSFAADGTSDTFGALLDDIRICSDPCSGTVTNTLLPIPKPKP